MSKAFDLSQVGRGHGITADLGPYRNKIINGDFAIGQRGANFPLSSVAKYGLDRWFLIPTGTAQISMTRTLDTVGAFAGNSHQYFATIGMGNTAGSGNAVVLQQKIEGAQTLANRKVTFTAYVASTVPGKISMEIARNFGDSGEAEEIIGHQEFDVGVDWTRCDFVVDLPTTVGKTLGSGHFIGASIWFSAGADFAARTGSIGEQTGIRYVSRVSLVEGDATAEDDPFSPRHIQQELALCQRYYVTDLIVRYKAAAFTGSIFYIVSQTLPVEMRATPTVSLKDGTVYTNTSNDDNTTSSALTMLANPNKRSVRVNAQYSGTSATSGFTCNMTADAEL